MKYIENIKIDTRALDFMLNNKGQKRPFLTPEKYQESIYKQWIDSGYNLESLYWESFGYDEFPFEVNIPYDNCKWWFSKLPPGSVFPYHQDIYSTNTASKRLWIAYQDYQPGHIFTYDSKVLTDYKQGDCFEFDDTLTWHGASNCGLTPKISLQIVMF